MRNLKTSRQRNYHGYRLKVQEVLKSEILSSTGG